MLKRGRKSLEWDQVRARLKPYFAKWGRTACEIRLPHDCTRTMFLGFAHPRKRNDLLPGEIWIVILACTNGHNIIEYQMTHQEMFDYVWKVIKKRGVYFDGEQEIYI